MDITLYSTPTCPRCKVISTKLEKLGIDFSKEMDEEVMMKKGLLSVPWLEVDGKMLDFASANKWLNEQEASK